MVVPLTSIGKGRDMEQSESRGGREVRLCESGGGGAGGAQHQTLRVRMWWWSGGRGRGRNERGGRVEWPLKQAHI